MKKTFLFLILFCALLLLPGCTTNNQSTADGAKTADILINSCTPGEITIEGYGDPGKQLANCLVQYPGEASRTDKVYYVVEDICGQFTQEFMENMLSSEIIKIKDSGYSGIYNCTYYTTDKDYIMLSLNYLDVETQKKDHQLMDRQIETDPRIEMEHFIVYQKDGNINEIYLIFNANKFISINRNSGNSMSSQEMLSLATNLSFVMKDFK